HHDRVIDDAVVRRPSCAVDAVERDPACVVVVEQIVGKDRILDAVAVDAGAAPAAIAVDDVVLDPGAGDDSVAPLAQIAVHVDTTLPVAPGDIAADDRAVSTIADVDPVLFGRIRNL